MLVLNKAATPEMEEALCILSLWPHLIGFRPCAGSFFLCLLFSCHQVHLTDLEIQGLRIS